VTHHHSTSWPSCSWGPGMRCHRSASSCSNRGAQAGAGHSAQGKEALAGACCSLQGSCLACAGPPDAA
jgi:hypothetical protein